ncbi:hypothetical protein [Reichenbachiella sp. MALMAid0571]|uniref:hypothetical protein n=1 Tax=Reichenbachiella sp. MALMAid0571 TaxID=3143939 RepID=UPI0032DF4F7B
MKKHILVLLTIGSISGFSCEEKDCCTIPEDTIIRYGTSFGFCIGYCKKTISITPSSINFEKSSWTDKDTHPDIHCNNEFTEWQSLNTKINFDAFNTMEAVIGCPDCADGGAEWIEITSGENSHKVTFEYNNAPNAFSSYIGILRNELQEIDSECE